MDKKQDDWQQRWHKALEEQHRNIFDYDKRSLKEQFAQYVNCPSCGNDSQRSKFIFEKDMFKYYRCRRCGLVYMNPRLNNTATASFYNSNVNAIYNERKFDIPDDVNQDNDINAKNFYLLETVRASKNKGILLEIGCAKGYFLKKAKEDGYHVWGLELNSKNCQYATNILGDTIINKDLIEARLDSAMFDVVYMRDVIEHLPNPREIMVEINRILKKDGILFIDTHNIDGFIHKIVQKKHTVIFGFEHPVHWSPKSLVYLFHSTGMKLKNIYFESIDFTLSCILSYFVESTFTTIIPENISTKKKVLFKFLRKPFMIFPFNKLDNKFMPFISNMLKAGSTMKVFARKIRDVA